MDEKPLQPPDRQTAPTGSSRRLSGLAVVALVVAAIPLCPLTGFVGALLGVLALRRIRLANGRLGGRGTATLAIVIGVAFAFIWSAVLDGVIQKQRETQKAMMIGAVGAAMQAADPAGALQVWSGGDPDRPSGGEIVSFGEEAAGRYGPFDRFSMISASSPGSLWRPTVEIAGTFHFADEAPLGSASFVLETPPGRIMPVFRLTRIFIEDGQRGDLILGTPIAVGDSAAEP